MYFKKQKENIEEAIESTNKRITELCGIYDASTDQAEREKIKNLINAYNEYLDGLKSNCKALSKVAKLELEYYKLVASCGEKVSTKKPGGKSRFFRANGRPNRNEEIETIDPSEMDDDD